MGSLDAADRVIIPVSAHGSILDSFHIADEDGDFFGLSNLDYRFKCRIDDVIGREDEGIDPFVHQVSCGLVDLG